MSPAAQAFPVVQILRFPLFPSTSSKSPLSSIVIWSSTMACLMDLLASRPRLAARAERLSRTHSVVAPRMFPLSTQASPVAAESLAAPLAFTALDSTAARLQAPSTRPPLRSLTPSQRALLRRQRHQLPPQLLCLLQLKAPQPRVHLLSQAQLRRPAKVSRQLLRAPRLPALPSSQALLPPQRQFNSRLQRSLLHRYPRSLAAALK